MPGAKITAGPYWKGKSRSQLGDQTPILSPSDCNYVIEGQEISCSWILNLATFAGIKPSCT